MYIETVNIKEFRILKDLQINFQPPENNNNVINIVAGVNGCGKTTLLEAIFQYMGSVSLYKKMIVKVKGDEENLPVLPETIPTQRYGFSLEEFFKGLQIKNDDKVGIFEDPRIIFIPATLNFQYHAIKQLSVDYYPKIKIDQSALGKAEYYIREYILAKERESHIADPIKRTQKAIASFNKIFEKTTLLTQLHDLDKNRFNRPVFKNVKEDLVTIDQLSDGEKQLYGRVVALMLLEPRNSVILIDEPEISLHPAWQQDIMAIYTSIGKNNQFIVATHSPQIIANTDYKNLILLVRQNNRIAPIYPQHPPSGVDVNSILTEIMGADSRPKVLDQLYQQYRQLVDTQQEDTAKGKEVKKAILQRESANSAFMQEMDFLIDLRD